MCSGEIEACIGKGVVGSKWSVKPELGNPKEEQL